ncbi:MAG TPA: acyl-CoA reductase [Kiritimatiellia bacterium]|nr:acyl-CoA reductase [Kiritimatiellia bacterium]
MEIVCPQRLTTNDEESITALAKRPSLPVFSPESLGFISDFSTTLLTHPEARSYPELLALAHWMRPVQIQTLKRTFLQRQPPRSHTTSRGNVLHFAPANVDSIFVYSWFLALLAGNKNIVRLSGRTGPQIEFLLGLLNRLLEKSDHKDIARRVLIVRYPPLEATTQNLVNLCQMRVLWGGDASVAALRSLPLSPRATELVFPDRFSMAAFNSEALCKYSDSQWMQLVELFYRDAFWFDQLACSSPRLLVWVGRKSASEKAKTTFWSFFSPYVEKKMGDLPLAHGLTSLNTAYALAAHEQTASLPATKLIAPYAFTVTDLTDILRELACGGGFFPQLMLPTLRDLAKRLTPKDQTLIAEGFEEAALLEMLQVLPSGALDRIVRPGQALAFSEEWDGQSLLTAFTRLVILP